MPHFYRLELVDAMDNRLDMQIYVARILYPVKVLGPGDRIGIWLDGCEHQCKGCSNPELWDLDSRYLTNISNVIDMVRSITEKKQIDGFTITGGDPFFQPEALSLLLTSLQDINKDILLYTGYKYESLKDKYENVLNKIAVLIDGKYEEDKNDGSILRGSSNQRILFIQPQFQHKYRELMSSGVNEIQNFSNGRAIVSVGIHKKDYQRELEERIKEKGLIANE